MRICGGSVRLIYFTLHANCGFLFFLTELPLNDSNFSSGPLLPYNSSNSHNHGFSPSPLARKSHHCLKIRIIPLSKYRFGFSFDNTTRTLHTLLSCYAFHKVYVPLETDYGAVAPPLPSFVFATEFRSGSITFSINTFIMPQE